MDQFNSKVDKVAQRLVLPSGRAFAFPKAKFGARSIPVLERSLPERIETYSRRRLATVARILTVLEVARNRSEQLRADRVQCEGAQYQMSTGTREWHACHTSPGSLKIDGHPLATILKNLALKRYAVVWQLDCMLMPAEVNLFADRALDDIVARDALAEAAGLLLSDSNVNATDGIMHLLKLEAKTLKDRSLNDALALFESLSMDETYSNKEVANVQYALASHLKIIEANQAPTKLIKETKSLIESKAEEAADAA